MSTTKEILRLWLSLGLSVREASRATGASTGVVGKVAQRAKAGLTWELLEPMSEGAGPSAVRGAEALALAVKPLPSAPYVIAEWRGATVSLDYHVALDDHWAADGDSGHAATSRRLLGAWRIVDG